MDARLATDERRLVSGGRMSVVSTPGQGTKITLIVPQVETLLTRADTPPARRREFARASVVERSEIDASRRGTRCGVSLRETPERVQ